MEHDRRDNPWERIAARLDEALDDARTLAARTPAPRSTGTPNAAASASSTANKLLDLLARARSEVHARELEASVASARAGRLQSELETQRRRAETLARIGKAINAVRRLDALLQLIIDLAVEATGAERGLIVVPDPGGGRQEYSAGANLEPDAVVRPEFSVSRSIIERVFKESAPLVTTDAQNDPQVDATPSIRSLHIRSINCVPIVGKSGTIGVLYVDSRIRTDNLFQHDPELLTSIADQAAVAIDNARLYDDWNKNFEDLSNIKAQTDEILESIASGVIMLDSNDTIVQFNRAAEITFGLSASTLEGRHARILNSWIPGFTTLLDQYKSIPEGRAEVEMRGTHFVRGPIVLQSTFLRVHSLTGAGVGTAVVVNDLTTRRRLEAENKAQLERSERVAKSFERYLAPHVVSDLLVDPDNVPLGGTRLTATMLFADIRGFTELSERLMPEEVVDMLNRYLAPTVDVVLANLGLLDKYYGDGIMAVFGAPRPAADDTSRAVLAARQILEQVELLNAQPGVHWPLSVSIGLATGDVVAGNIGSERRLEYTVVGSAVNLAQRLQSIAEPNQILADARTYEKVRGQVAATRRQARIKGRAGLTDVYVLHG
ncbi:MAG: GAF domain-containing protein [Candidatus Eremiobacteraeota bacterium]|nr:GAF domain-containing protein [Candidatus Eremiobacteraeota bacterium]MBV8366348.1 GAF domain-containing protein [Candidatus Eremiobacteraeota bacterium]